MAWGAAPRGTTRRSRLVVLSSRWRHSSRAAAAQSLAQPRTARRPPFCSRTSRPARRPLNESPGVRHAYASLGPAFRLGRAAGGIRVSPSPPWNDRFRHWPLPLLDEVRFAKELSPGCTPPRSGRAPCRPSSTSRCGGRRALAPPGACRGRSSTSASFRRSLRGRALARRGDRPATATCAASSRRPRLPSSCACRPRPLTGVTLLAAPDRPRLPRSSDLEHGADGRSFERCLARRRRRGTADLRWLNGRPAVLTNVFASALVGARRGAAAHAARSPERSGGWARCCCTRRTAGTLGRVAVPRARLGGAGGGPSSSSRGPSAQDWSRACCSPPAAALRPSRDARAPACGVRLTTRRGRPRDRPYARARAAFPRAHLRRLPVRPRRGPVGEHGASSSSRCRSPAGCELALPCSAPTWTRWSARRWRNLTWGRSAPPPQLLDQPRRRSRSAT